MAWLQKTLSDTSTSMVLFSLILSIVNLIDTNIRIYFVYVRAIRYPLGVFLKPVFFVFQAFICIYFLEKARSSTVSSSNKEFVGLLETQLVFVTLSLALYVLYSVLDFGKLGYLVFYMEVMWLFAYTIIPLTSLWFSLTLMKIGGNRAIILSFFLISLVFLSAIPDKIFFWTQNVFGVVIPESLANLGSYGPHVFMSLAVFSVLGWLTHKSKKLLLYLIPLVAIAILPAVLDFYGNWLLNLIMRTIFYWGLGYKGSGWFSVSLFLSAFGAYIISIKAMASRFDRSTSSFLLLLGAISFPFNGVMLLFQGFSSIPGNVLSLNSVILGFLIKNQQRNK